MTQPAPKKAPYSTPSPSAIALLDMCEARAGAKYIERLSEPEGMKAKLGTRCHAIAADYLSKGTAPNRSETFEIPKRGKAKAQVFYPGRIVQNVLHHLPPAGSVPDVERKISLVWGGIHFHPESSIDWENALGYGDHKFTTSVQYAKTEAELVPDPQRVIYAADWFQRHDADNTVGQWTYGQFDLRASKKVLVPATRTEIAQLMNDVIVPKAEKLLGYVAKGVDWRTLPKNTNACGKFPPDGCPYAAQCPRSKQERRSLIMGSAFMEKLKAKKAAAAGGVNSANLEQQLQASVSANDNTPPETASADVDTDAEEGAAAIVGAINPPGEVGEVLDVQESEEQPAAEVTPAAPAPTVEAPKRRGRPKKEKPEPQPAPLSKAEIDARVDAAEKAAAEEDYVGDAEKALAKSLVLLVDCLPARGMGDVTLASDLIEQAHAHVRKGDGSPESEVLDYRLVEYGKGAGFLSACVAALAADLPHDTIVVLETKSPEGMIALQPLMAAATTVIRGV